jgi:hypothetical protein
LISIFFTKTHIIDFDTLKAIVESTHWGLGSGLGALLGGIAYSSYGAVALFQVCSLISFFSTALALMAASLHGGEIPRTRILNSDIEFTALPVALIDSAEDRQQDNLEVNCEPGLTKTVEYREEAHDSPPGGPCTLRPYTKDLPVVLPSQGQGDETCAPHSKVVRSAGNAVLCAPVSASETVHGVGCIVAPQMQCAHSLTL